MHILITGSNFITRNFEEKFAKKWELSYLPEEHLADISMASAAFRKNQYDMVLHLAGKSAEDEDSAATNLIYFRNLQYACTLGKVKRLLYCVQGADRFSEAINATEPQLESAEVKDGLGRANQMIYELAKKDKFTTVLRLGYVYGKYQKADESPIIAMITSALGSKKIKKLGVPQERKVTLTYVDDCVKLLGRFITENKPKGSYNLCSGDEVSLGDAAVVIHKAAAKLGIDFELEPAKVTANEYTLSNQRVAVFFNDVSFTSIRSGVNKLFKMFQEDRVLLNMSL